MSGDCEQEACKAKVQYDQTIDKTQYKFIDPKKMV